MLPKTYFFLLQQSLFTVEKMHLTLHMLATSEHFSVNNKYDFNATILNLTIENKYSILTLSSVHTRRGCQCNHNADVFLCVGINC